MKKTKIKLTEKEIEALITVIEASAIDIKSQYVNIIDKVHQKLSFAYLINIIKN